MLSMFTPLADVRSAAAVLSLMMPWNDE